MKKKLFILFCVFSSFTSSFSLFSSSSKTSPKSLRIKIERCVSSILDNGSYSPRDRDKFLRNLLEFEDLDLDEEAVSRSLSNCLRSTKLRNLEIPKNWQELKPKREPVDCHEEESFKFQKGFGDKKESTFQKMKSQTSRVRKFKKTLEKMKWRLVGGPSGELCLQTNILFLNEGSLSCTHQKLSQVIELIAFKGLGSLFEELYRAQVLTGSKKKKILRLLKGQMKGTFDCSEVNPSYKKSKIRIKSILYSLDYITRCFFFVCGHEFFFGPYSHGEYTHSIHFLFSRGIAFGILSNKFFSLLRNKIEVCIDRTFKNHPVGFILKLSFAEKSLRGIEVVRDDYALGSDKLTLDDDTLYEKVLSCF